MDKIFIYMSLLILFIVVVVNAHAGNKTVGANNMSVVHKSSNGTSIAFPDVCKTPTLAEPVPIPYPNIGQSSDTDKGSKKVKMDGNPTMIKDSEFKQTEGDEPGTE